MKNHQFFEKKNKSIKQHLFNMCVYKLQLIYTFQYKQYSANLWDLLIFVQFNHTEEQSFDIKISMTIRLICVVII